ncbi:MAG: DUF501 domain-containing protein [Acidimicrobiia bacterium]
MADSDDRRVIELQIGRPLRADSTVVTRCHLDLPVVVRVPPHLDDGTPFPTLYWLTCPLATTRIGRLEGAGGVKRMEAKAASEPAFGGALDRAHRAYAAERDALVENHGAPQPTGGVAGTAAGVKCLHAHYAHTAGGGDNPVGRLVAGWIEPLDCVVPCIMDGAPNSEWVGTP